MTRIEIPDLAMAYGLLLVVVMFLLSLLKNWDLFNKVLDKDRIISSKDEVIKDLKRRLGRE